MNKGLWTLLGIFVGSGIFVGICFAIDNRMNGIIGPITAAAGFICLCSFLGFIIALIGIAIKGDKSQ
ncbi:MAG: hypothetical protein ACKVTZ_23340 [Bacteroidia bacterium]